MAATVWQPDICAFQSNIDAEIIKRFSWKDMHSPLLHAWEKNKLKSSSVNPQNNICLWAALSALHNLLGQYLPSKQTLVMGYLAEEH